MLLLLSRLPSSIHTRTGAPDPLASLLPPFPADVSDPEFLKVMLQAVQDHVQAAAVAAAETDEDSDEPPSLGASDDGA